MGHTILLYAHNVPGHPGRRRPKIGEKWGAPRGAYASNFRESETRQARPGFNPPRTPVLFGTKASSPPKCSPSLLQEASSASSTTDVFCQKPSETQAVMCPPSQMFRLHSGHDAVRALGPHADLTYYGTLPSAVPGWKRRAEYAWSGAVSYFPPFSNPFPSLEPDSIQRPLVYNPYRVS